MVTGNHLVEWEKMSAKMKEDAEKNQFLRLKNLIWIKNEPRDQNAKPVFLG